MRPHSSGGAPLVPVMKPANLRYRDNSSAFRYEAEQSKSKLTTRLQGVTGKRPITRWAEQFFRMQLKSVRYVAAEVVGDDPREVFLSRVPSLVTHTDSTENKYRLVLVCEIGARVASFIEVEEVHEGRLRGTN